MTYDLVIRGGNLADGRGGPIYQADIAVTDGKIAALGTVTDPGREEIDASGHLVTPGFVDIHSHYDGQAIWDDRLLSSGWHGVTTTVMGNCGVGFAPVRPDDRDLLVGLMEGVEAIPAAVMREGLTWEWTSFPDYLDALERRPHDMDVCAYLPHSALRVFVMGQRAVRRETATSDDIAQMRQLAREAIRAGAIGFSTSKSFNHRTVSGDLIPSLGADGKELEGIAMGLKDEGRGVLQIILNLSPDLRRQEFELIRGMVARSGRPLSVTVLQRNRDPDGWREVMDMLDGAVADGLPMRAQITPRPLGTLFGLDTGRHPFSYHPSYRAIEDKPLAERVALMRDPGLRAKLVSEKPENDIPSLVARVQNFEYMFPFGDPPNYAPSREDCVAAMAEAQGRSPFEIVYDLLLEDDGHAMLFAPNSGIANYNFNACFELLQNPNTVVGLADGGAHVAHISDTSFPTFLLSYWGRDRPEGTLDLGKMVARLTTDPAEVVGLKDRGVLAPGFKADINVIDFDRLQVERPYMVHDLPKGAKRLLQKARGYTATIVAGQPVYREGEATGALPGTLVRGAQPAPRA
ncbi:MAG: amidohydrolase family protein [Alphaproteobacteria bacterium]|nr:amidohydrolase family protein [Alphaproteobacteria bacterium]MCZ6495273.1 amidohydrolase family protein [Alphaproteobacteria bacterium]